MFRSVKSVLLSLAFLSAFSAVAAIDSFPLLQNPWYVARSAHFYLYSCAPRTEVAKVAARLEQFREAYASLAGTASVASPPILVIVFPDHASMLPYLPTHQGKPASLTAFFRRGGDENLIVMPVGGDIGATMETIYHEYAHVLFRHNDPFWPLWLKEGMAEMYSTFALGENRQVKIGRMIPRHVEWVTSSDLIPLRQLFSVNFDSPEYNERRHQGVFYAESWLLTHFLMTGNGPNRGQFGRMTALLREGQSPESAFTNAFGLSLTVMEDQLRRYAHQPHFNELTLSVPRDLNGPRGLATRPISRSEACFRLGDVLLRVGRVDAAEVLMHDAQAIDQKSALPWEGLGLIAAERDKSSKALEYLDEAFHRGDGTFLSHYVYAREKIKLTSDVSGRIETMDADIARRVREELKKALDLMPDFGPAHHMLGIVELVQGGNFDFAEKEIRRAIELEPENLSYSFGLAQVQIHRSNFTGAKATLAQLRRPYVSSELRNQAEELLRKIN